MVCSCSESRFFGDFCGQVRVEGPCADEPCGNGVCQADSSDPAVFTCSCDAGWLEDDQGVCSEELEQDAEPTCSDGIVNGFETDIDCGIEDLEIGCGLCAQGLACETSENCDGELVCSAGTNTCTAPVRQIGVYVEMAGVKLQGVNKKQFLESLAEPYKASIAAATGASEVTITRVEDQAATGARVLQSGSGSGIEVDSSVRFPVTASAEETRTAVTGYVSGTPASGGNGLLDDLIA